MLDSKRIRSSALVRCELSPWETNGRKINSKIVQSKTKTKEDPSNLKKGLRVKTVRVRKNTRIFKLEKCFFSTENINWKLKGSHPSQLRNLSKKVAKCQSKTQGWEFCSHPRLKSVQKVKELSGNLQHS